MTPLIQEVVQFVPDIAADYVWFDISAADHTKELDHDQSLTLLQQNPLPFERCAIAGIDLDGNKYVVLVSNQTSGKYAGSLRCESATRFDSMNGYMQRDPVFYCNPMDNTPEGVPLYFEDTKYANDKQVHQLANVSMLVTSLFLQSINNGHSDAYKLTKRANHAKRLRQGKKAFFDWHTVIIEKPQQHMPHQGGSHASPRLHDVRGHWVTRNGKRFWRKAHQRGDASLGIVFHDYKVKGEANARP